MEKPIRILHVLGTLNRGGAETMVMNIYRNIDSSKVQFDFIVHTNNKCDYCDEIVKLGGKIYNIPRYTGRNHFKYKRAWNDFFNNHSEYKIIHGHMRSTAAIYLNIAKKHGLVAIAHSHSTASRGNKIEQVVKTIIQFPIRYISDYLFACSDEAGKWLFGKRAIRGNNYKIIKNAIDFDKYIFNESTRNEVRRNLGIEDKFVIGHVGSFTHPKNHKFLINLFYKIQIKNNNSVLLLVGDGELRMQIEKQIKSLGINDKVILTGVVENVNDYLQAMDVFAFPSIFEGLGIATIEAQVSGLPCIISDVVPREICITNLVKFIDIKLPHQVWIDEILGFSNSQRENFLEHGFRKEEYDIEKVSKDLELMYIGIYVNRFEVQHK